MFKVIGGRPWFFGAEVVFLLRSRFGDYRVGLLACRPWGCPLKHPEIIRATCCAHARPRRDKTDETASKIASNPIRPASAPRPPR